MSTVASSQLWDPVRFDLTPYGKVAIFDTGIPTGILVFCTALYFYRQGSGFSKNNTASADSKSLLSDGPNSSYGATSGTATDGELLKKAHFDIHSLAFTASDGVSQHGHYIPITPSSFEKFKSYLEFTLLLLQVIIHMYYLLFFKFSFTYIVQFVLWSSILLMDASILARKHFSGNKVHAQQSFWPIICCAYTTLFVAYILFIRSILIMQASPLKQYYVSQLVIITILWSISWTCTVGDSANVQLYKTEGLQPSPERSVSVLNFLLYSWINPLMNQVFKEKNLTMLQIWGLRDDDYAYIVLRSFEDFKCSFSFANKLFLYFTDLFAIQAICTVAESFLMFAPTYFLKKILEYVQAPDDYPTSLAWFYLFLMFFLRLIYTLCFGVALFSGRRICIRMKAIIIGEIYSKGLRRRIAVSTSKPSKNADDEDKEEVKEARDLGGIINLMSVDAFKVSEICGYFNYFISGALSASIAIIFLYQLLGWSALVGAIAIVALLPVNYKISILVGDLQKKILGITDKRIQKLNESLQSIRIIKFFTWELKFLQSIMDVRSEELSALKRRCLVSVGGNFLSFLIPTFVTILSFGCYIFIEGRSLTTPVAFTSLSLFNLLRIPLDELAYMLSFVIQSKVSLDRVNDFLLEPETTKYEQISDTRDSDSPFVGFQNDATFSWESSDQCEGTDSKNSTSTPEELDSFRLRDLNVSFNKGKLNVIIGPTGSGKTSMLLALLGEMSKISGKVFLGNTSIASNDVAYCAQSAWLLNATVRDNITFNTPFNGPRYDAVVKACALSRDFEILEYGDQTEVGEKGITLSGGQKQRVSLARALYSTAKIVILDDVLSAVDSHTALWIYENAISGPLMQGRTCILVSHNVSLTIKKAKTVTVLDNGRIVGHGSVKEVYELSLLGDDELIKAAVEESINPVAEVLPTVSESLCEDACSEDDGNDVSYQVVPLHRPRLRTFSRVSALSEDLESISVDEVTVVRTTTKNNNNKPKAGKLIQEEAKADGVVGFDVYLFYASRFGTIIAWVSLITLFIGSQFINIGQSWWLRQWAAASEKSLLERAAYNTMNFLLLKLSGHEISQGQSSVHGSVAGIAAMVVTDERMWKSPMASVLGSTAEANTVFYMAVYTIIGFVFAFICCLRDYMVFVQGIHASNSIFVELLDKVFRAKLRFFDSTPIGRIMNRFSRDIESIDQQLAPMAQGSFISLISTISTLVLIISITPVFFIFAILIMLMFYSIAVYYLTLSRELKRYESILRSPIHQHFSETLIGVTTIRAYGQEHRFMRENLMKIDNNNRPFFYLWVANRWLHLRVDTAGSLVTFFAGAFVILSVKYLDAGLAGLSLSYAISFTESALWIVRLYAEVEMTMNSVERLQEYLEIEQEPARDMIENKPASSWPDKGMIEVNNVSLRYAPELPLVIKNVSFTVGSNCKVGIVGRTGAGKSTIITALFRFLDPETGFIKIDGVDITSIGLDDLRKAITIIPQDPTLFTGTIRSNLDMFDEHTDIEIYNALRRVNLISVTEFESLSNSGNPSIILNNNNDGENKNKFLDLSNAVEEGGKNLSQGQRQLMCLARSLLRAPKVMLLDEATASIDYNSDAMIQQTIRSEFGNSTILTIAHRLRSIIDYDYILVMDAGEVKEYAAPYKLISDTKSIFYSMCKDSGELDTLITLAKEAYEK